MTNKTDSRDAPSSESSFAQRMERLWQREEFLPETVLDLALMRDCIREQRAALDGLLTYAGIIEERDGDLETNKARAVLAKRRIE